MKNYIILFIALLLSCNNVENQGKDEEKTAVKSCESLIQEFKYPDDLSRFDTMKYICDSNALPLYFHANKKAIPYFSDKNFALFSHDSWTKLLFDKKNNMYICFKVLTGCTTFSVNTISSIYFLGENEMPLFWISMLYGDSSTIRLFKFHYIGNFFVFVNRIHLTGSKEFTTETIDYNDIIYISKEMLESKFTETNEPMLLEPEYIKKPYWKDY